MPLEEAKQGAVAPVPGGTYAVRRCSLPVRLESGNVAVVADAWMVDHSSTSPKPEQRPASVGGEDRKGRGIGAITFARRGGWSAAPGFRSSVRDYWPTWAHARALGEVQAGPSRQCPAGAKMTIVTDRTGSRLRDMCSPSVRDLVASGAAATRSSSRWM